jgi:hypothetical protein
MEARRMISAPRLREEIAAIGYSVIERDYVFSDIFASPSPGRTVELAAFTHKPPSYRNAALAVVEIKQGMAREVAADYRALGAPLLFAIEGQEVTVWEVRTDGHPTVIDRRDWISCLPCSTTIGINGARVESTKQSHSVF